MGHVNGNIVCISQRPGHWVIPAPDTNLQPLEVNPTNTNDVEDESSRLVVKLSQLPRTLHDLWHEWEFGFSGKKPAKLFSVSEHGKVKHTFYKRKFFWHKCAEMVWRDLTAHIACDKIYEVYGQGQTITYILEHKWREILLIERAILNYASSRFFKKIGHSSFIE